MHGFLENPRFICIFNGKAISDTDTLEEIGQYSFASCTNFSGTLIIPKNVHIIQNSAFFGCIGFEEVKFQNSDTLVESFAFSQMHNKCFDNVPESLMEFGHFLYWKIPLSNFL